MNQTMRENLTPGFAEESSEGANENEDHDDLLSLSDGY